jgi:hypothetical protein
VTNRPADRFLTHSTSVGPTGTEVLFPKWIIALKVVSEQFWGRAARASNDSQESGRLLIFAGKSSSPGSAFSVFSTRSLRLGFFADLRSSVKIRGRVSF